MLADRVELSNRWLLMVVIIYCVIMGLVYPKMASPSKNASVVSDVEYLVETGDALALKDIVTMVPQAWQSSPQRIHSFGMSTLPHWFKFTLSPAKNQRPRLLELGSPLLDHVSVWFQGEETILSEYHTGDSVTFAQRPIENELFLFPIPQVDPPITVYVRIQTTGALRLSLNLWSESSFISFTGQDSILIGLCFGLMLAMGISYFLTTRLVTFAVYSGYVLSVTLSLAAFHGMGYRYLWPESAEFQQHALPLFANLTLGFLIIFCDFLLNVNNHSNKLSRVLKGLAGLYFACAALSLFTPLFILNSGFLVMLLASGILIYGTGIWLWFKGVSLAGVYTLAWSVLFFAGFIVCLDNLNVMKLDLPLDYLMVLGAVIETLLLAIVLVISNSQQRHALKEAQNELLAQAVHDKKVQQTMLALQENTQEELEYKVQERTLELEITLRELSEINRELQEKNNKDALTGIRNRSYFNKKYIAEIRRSRREQTQLSIVMLDIDHFKGINDKYGHLVGDDCIKAVASILQNALKRPSDDLCRYGGEEFVLILPSTELAGAMSLVEHVRKTIEQNQILSDGFCINVTISAGVATAIVKPQDAEDRILAAADQQLYLAKNSGRNNVKGVYITDDATAVLKE